MSRPVPILEVPRNHTLTIVPGGWPRAIQSGISFGIYAIATNKHRTANSERLSAA